MRKGLNALAVGAVTMASIVLASAPVFAAGAAPAQAAPTGAPSTGTRVIYVHGNATQTNEVIYGPVGEYPSNWPQASSCWTSFDPSSPGGRAMNHYYENCGSYVTTVCPAVRINGVGPLYVFIDHAVYLHAKPTVDYGVDWHYEQTTKNGWYTTVTC
ncbi:hypothetical protein ACFVSN_30305 [Kitasatospora sp. NPDC057904]|uniref:hypothetical protein n=1 Tax=unclassified Kitasatospora TaxID=2633591 RepID=UPI0036DE68DB